MYDQVDGRGDLLTDSAQGQLHAGHQDHGFEAAQSVTRGVGVQRAQAAVVPRVHSL